MSNPPGHTHSTETQRFKRQDVLSEKCGATNFTAAEEARRVAVISRDLCSAAERCVSYEEFKDLKKSNIVHIDVRERWEIDRFGKIPESINIPLSELAEALQMSPADFEEQYRQKMPAKSDHMVFSCLAGVRSKQALGFAMALGFSRLMSDLHSVWVHKELKDQCAAFI
ncbi:thiosulfate:glutathione sulfurtransferase isoform X2 [Struthio camelus]|uniref:thiosulfate:glutathione sulfurtransferase isoform X2 n=1 Tax=Struthio camelus TaxID=8801 RepID=UPI003603B60C